MERSDAITESLNCANHKIHNTVKECNKKSEGMKIALEKAKRLVKHFKKSTVAANNIKAACAKTDHVSLKMMPAMKVRWNSVHDSVERLLNHEECVCYMDRHDQLQNVSQHIPDRNEWKLLGSMVEVLKPVKSVTKVFESESKPTINKVVENIFDLVEILKEEAVLDSNPAVTKTYAKSLEKYLIKRFPQFGLKDDAVALGNLLDPGLKGVHLKLNNSFEKVTKLAVKRIFDYEQELPESDS